MSFDAQESENSPLNFAAQHKLRTSSPQTRLCCCSCYFWWSPGSSSTAAWSLARLCQSLPLEPFLLNFSCWVTLFPSLLVVTRESNRICHHSGRWQHRPHPLAPSISSNGGRGFGLAGEPPHPLSVVRIKKKVASSLFLVFFFCLSTTITTV